MLTAAAIKPVRVLLCVHDAGGVNLAVPLLRAWQNSRAIAVSVLAMPAVRRGLSDAVPGIAWAEGNEDLNSSTLQDSEKLEALLRRVVSGRYDVVLCGTSLHVPLERRLINAARQASIPAIAYCDMAWAIEQRLRDDAGWAVPDRLWVADDETRAAAMTVQWPRKPMIEVIGHTMIDDLMQRAHRGNQKGKSIRFVSEPASIEFPEARVDEFAAAEALVHAARAVGGDPVVIRTHPAEPQESWRRWIHARRDRGVSLDSLPLEEAIADTRCAVGLCSSLLTQMRMCRVPAASLQLPAGNPAYFCLPFTQFDIAQIRSADALTQWLRTQNDAPVPAGASVHAGAIERATSAIAAVAGKVTR